MLGRREPAYWDQVATTANNRVREMVEATARRPHLYGDTNVFAHAGYEQMRLLLAQEGLVPRGSNPGIFEAQLSATFAEAMSQAISSLATYDKSNDGAISSDEATGMWFSIGTTR